MRILTDSYKGAIPQGQEEEVIVTGKRNSPTSLIRRISMTPEAFSAWQIKDETQILPSCMSLIFTAAYNSFITYRPVPHLDRKHTVFGKVVGGLEILDKLENIPTDHDERPKEEIKINNIIIFVDPFDVISRQISCLMYRNGRRNGRTKMRMMFTRKRMPKN